MTQPTQTPATSPEAPAGEARRWRGHTHEELYRLLHEGPGAAASAEPSRRWQEIATNLDEIGQDLRKALEQSGAGWAGQAAGRAYDRLSVTATWAAETSTAAADMRVAVENQGDHIAKARADMPVPEDVPAAEPDPAVAPAVQVAQTQNDLEGPEAAASSAEERAFEVMAAYELNSETTTAALATFTEPPALVERHDMHRGGGIEHHEARPSGLLGWLRPHRREHHRPWWHHFVGGDRWQAPTTSASTPWVEQPTPRAPAPVVTPSPPPAPGGFSGAVLTPMAPGRGSEDRPRSTNRSTGGPATGAVPGGSSGSAPPRVGASAGALPPPDLQAAAASQAAATAHHTGAPVAPATGAPVGQADRMALRRFGVEAIGSSQWFGDTEEPVVGEAPRRRWDLRQPDGVTESVTILGEEHQLPPTVIGDGHTPR